MTPVSALVQTTAREMTPDDLKIPGVVWSVFTALNKVHGVWRWYRQIELYRNPDNFTQLLAGHAVNLVVGDYLLVRIAAQCVLIATRIMECVDQQIALYREGCLWVHAVCGHYPVHVKEKWSVERRISWISSSSANWWKTVVTEMYYQLKRVILITIGVFGKTFKLSMKMMDAMDAFSLSPATRNEGINEFFVNTLKGLDALVDKKEDLMQSLASNRVIVEKILYSSPFNYEQLYLAVSKTLDRTESIYQGAKGIAQFGNGIIVDFGKRAVNTGMVVAGLGDLRPTCVLPSMHRNPIKFSNQPQPNYPPASIPIF